MTSHSDPGDQTRGKRRAKHPPRRPADPQQGDLFAPPQPEPPIDREPQKRKEKALEHHGKVYARVLLYLRGELREVYRTRGTFVTADDARLALRRSPYKALEGDDMPWLGALFRQKGWKHTGQWVPSVFAGNNGRQNRCWIWEGQ